MTWTHVRPVTGTVDDTSHPHLGALVTHPLFRVDHTFYPSLVSTLRPLRPTPPSSPSPSSPVTRPEPSNPFVSLSVSPRCNLFPNRVIGGPDGHKILILWLGPSTETRTGGFGKGDPTRSGSLPPLYKRNKVRPEIDTIADGSRDLLGPPGR